MRMMTWEKGEGRGEGYSRRVIFKKESKPTRQQPHTYRIPLSVEDGSGKGNEIGRSENNSPHFSHESDESAHECMDLSVHRFLL